jgi:hypothetical protein
MRRKTPVLSDRQQPKRCVHQRGRDHQSTAHNEHPIRSEQDARCPNYQTASCHLDIKRRAGGVRRGQDPVGNNQSRDKSEGKIAVPIETFPTESFLQLLFDRLHLLSQYPRRPQPRVAIVYKYYLAELRSSRLDICPPYRSANLLVISGNAGGLNGSLQHLLEVFIYESMTLISFPGVNSNKSKLCLGSDRVQSYRSILDGKYCQLNRLDSVASTGGAGSVNRPSLTMLALASL